MDVILLIGDGAKSGGKTSLDDYLSVKDKLSDAINTYFYFIKIVYYTLVIRRVGFKIAIFRVYFIAN